MMGGVHFMAGVLFAVTMMTVLDSGNATAPAAPEAILSALNACHEDREKMGDGLVACAFLLEVKCPTTPEFTL